MGTTIVDRELIARVTSQSTTQQYTRSIDTAITAQHRAPRDSRSAQAVTTVQYTFSTMHREQQEQHTTTQGGTRSDSIHFTLQRER